MKKSNLRKAFATLLCLIMALSAAGCTNSQDGDTAGTDPGTSEPTTATETATDNRDTIVLATAVEPATLCGLNLRSTSPGYMLIFNTTQMVNELVPASADSEYYEEVVMAAITDYEVSEDELTWTFTVKEGMKFFGGNDITARDIVETFKIMVPADQADPLAVPKGHYTAFESVDYIDDYHFSIKTYEPCPSMMRILCSYSSGIWDANLLADYPLDQLGTSPETMNTSGPYQLAEWVPGEYLLLEANPNYHTVSIHGDNAKTKYLKVMFIPDAAAREAALESGEVDVAYGLNAESGDNLKMNPEMVVEATDNCSIYTMRFGCNNDITGDLKVRQALLYALDRKAIANALYGDYWYEITGFTSHIIWGFLDEGHIEQDQDKARELLAEAGYPDGFETKIYASTTGFKYVQLSEAIAAQLAEIGITAEVVPVEDSVYQSMISGSTIGEFNYPLFIKETGGRTREFGSVVHTWYETSPDGTNALNNSGFYSNAQVDALSAEANATLDDAGRLELFQEIQRICYTEDPPQVNIAGLVDIWAHSEKLTGAWMNAGGIIEFDEAVLAN